MRFALRPLKVDAKLKFSCQIATTQLPVNLLEVILDKLTKAASERDGLAANEAVSSPPFHPGPERTLDHRGP